MNTMYVWNSKLLKQWAGGYIIVCGINVDAARIIARVRFGEWLAKEKDWYDEDQIKDAIITFESDIAVEPHSAHVLFINGSD